MEAGNFTGTLSFLVKTGESAEEKDYPEVDFAATDVPRLPYTLAVQPGQTLVMRLDQYVDAKIVWPTDCSDVKLILVEAGPFGGKAPLPAWPEDVIFAFHRYDTGSDNIPGSASTHSPIAKPDYDFSVDVNQGTVDLTWKDPVLTGKVAWIDMEFNGDSRNSGWYRLGFDASLQFRVVGNWLELPGPVHGWRLGLGYRRTQRRSADLRLIVLGYRHAHRRVDSLVHPQKRRRQHGSFGHGQGAECHGLVASVHHHLR